jgi:hypothetical protein
MHQILSSVSSSYIPLNPTYLNLILLCVETGPVPYDELYSSNIAKQRIAHDMFNSSFSYL